MALARKLAVILHRMLITGEAFRWPEKQDAGWTIIERHDLTPDHATSNRRQLSADAAQKDALTTLLGDASYTERQASLHARLECLEEGMLRRELFAATI